MAFVSEPLERAIEELARLPGIGRKTAQRFALFLMKTPEEDVGRLASAILNLKREIFYCPRCYNLAHRDEECSICIDPRRATGQVCVVPDIKEVYAIEKTGEFKGRYHVLGGLISPLDNVGPADLHIAQLLHRLRDGEPISELILAIPSNAEGEATSFYLNRLIKPLEITVSRLAYGIPMGAELEYIDDLTLTRALSGRQKMG
jgi:recombination protein RecR